MILCRHGFHLRTTRFCGLLRGSWCLSLLLTSSSESSLTTTSKIATSLGLILLPLSVLLVASLNVAPSVPAYDLLPSLSNAL